MTPAFALMRKVAHAQCVKPDSIAPAAVPVVPLQLEGWDCRIFDRAVTVLVPHFGGTIRLQPTLKARKPDRGFKRPKAGTTET